MHNSRVLSGILFTIGALLLVLALLAGLAFLSALSERLNYGPGMMFADVEFFALLALLSAVVGVLLFIAARRLRR